MTACGQWMPRNAEPCAKAQGHLGYHRSASAISTERAAQRLGPAKRAELKLTRVNHRAAKRAEVSAIKLARGCADCGYREDSVALDFDHLPQFEKLGNLNVISNGSRERTLAEIAKCEVVCANCHRIRTHNRAVGIELATPAFEQLVLF